MRRLPSAGRRKLAGAGLPDKGDISQMESAKMQPMNWNDLRYLLAVGRGRTLAAAARLLAVDDTTVARRLAALQAGIGARRCPPLPHGTLQLARAGDRAGPPAR